MHEEKNTDATLIMNFTESIMFLVNILIYVEMNCVQVLSLFKPLNPVLC